MASLISMLEVGEDVKGLQQEDGSKTYLVLLLS